MTLFCLEQFFSTWWNMISKNSHLAKYADVMFLWMFPNWCLVRQKLLRMCNGQLQLVVATHLFLLDLGEPSLTNHRLARRFLPLENHRKPLISKIDFFKTSFCRLIFKNLCKTFVPKVWLYIFEGFEIVSKNLRRFWKVFENHTFN